MNGIVRRPRIRAGAHSATRLDSLVADRLLAGRAPYGTGHDHLVRLLDEARATASPAELAFQDEALATFRTAVERRRDARDGVVPLQRRSRRPAPRSAMPIVASILAVAACAAMGVFAYTATGDQWARTTVGPPYRSGAPAIGPAGAGPAGGVGPGSAGAPVAQDTHVPGRASRGGTAVSGGAMAVGDQVPGAQARQSIAAFLSARPVPAGERSGLASTSTGATPSSSSPASQPGSGTPTDSSGSATGNAPQGPPTGAPTGSSELAPAVAPGAPTAPDVVAPPNGAPPNGAPPNGAAPNGGSSSGSSSSGSSASGSSVTVSIAALPANIRGLCTSWRNAGGSSTQKAKQASHAQLVAAAGGAGSVDALCATVLASH